MTNSPFIAPARAQTMLRDFEAHRKAVRSGDVENIDQTWDRCERWVDQLRPDFTEQAEAAQQRIKTLEGALTKQRRICQKGGMSIGLRMAKMDIIARDALKGEEK